MKNLTLLAIILAVSAASCTTQKSYFTVGLRTTIEKKSLPLTAIQYYVDRDVELRSEVSSQNAKVSSGVIKFENGKYVHIVVLKKNTRGICTQSADNKISVSFEDGKALSFGAPKGSSPDTRYQIGTMGFYGNNPANTVGKVKYDTTTYYIQPDGIQAMLQIKKSDARKLQIEKRKMKGRKVAQ